MKSKAAGSACEPPKLGPQREIGRVTPIPSTCLDPDLPRQSHCAAACGDYTCESVATRNIQRTIPKLRANFTTSPWKPRPWIVVNIRSIVVPSCSARLPRTAPAAFLRSHFR